MLGFLLEPLNALSRVGVAAGAFAMFLDHNPKADSIRDLEALAHFSSEQITELALFVNEVNPEAVRQAAGFLAGHAVGLASFTATTAVLLRRDAAGSEAPHQAQLFS